MGKIYRYGRWIEVDDEDLFSGPYDHPEYFDRQQWVDLAGGGASDATAQGDVCPMSTSRAHKPSLAEERTEPERAALMGMIVSALSRPAHREQVGDVGAGQLSESLRRARADPEIPPERNRIFPSTVVSQLTIRQNRPPKRPWGQKESALPLPGPSKSTPALDLLLEVGPGKSPSASKIARPIGPLVPPLTCKPAQLSPKVSPSGLQRPPSASKIPRPSQLTRPPSASKIPRPISPATQYPKIRPSECQRPPSTSKVPYPSRPSSEDINIILIHTPPSAKDATPPGSVQTPEITRDFSPAVPPSSSKARPSWVQRPLSASRTLPDTESPLQITEPSGFGISPTGKIISPPNGPLTLDSSFETLIGPEEETPKQRSKGSPPPGFAPSSPRAGPSWIQRPVPRRRWRRQAPILSPQDGPNWLQRPSSGKLIADIATPEPDLSRFSEQSLGRTSASAFIPEPSFSSPKAGPSCLQKPPLFAEIAPASESPQKTFGATTPRTVEPGRLPRPYWGKEVPVSPGVLTPSPKAGPSWLQRPSSAKAVTSLESPRTPCVDKVPPPVEGRKPRMQRWANKAPIVPDLPTPSPVGPSWLKRPSSAKAVTSPKSPKTPLPVTTSPAAEQGINSSSPETGAGWLRRRPIGIAVYESPISDPSILHSPRPAKASLPPAEVGPSYPRRPPMQSRIPRPPALPRPQSGSKLALPPDYCVRLDRPPSASKIPLPPGLSRAAMPSRIPQPPADAIEQRRTPQIARPRSISKVPLASGLSRQGAVARPPAGVRPPPACPVPSVRRPPPVARPSVVQRPAPVRRVSRGRLMPPPQLKVSAPRQAKPKGPQRPGLARQKKAILEKQLQRDKELARRRIMDNKELEDHINYLERQYSKILNNLNEEIRQEEEGLQAAAILEPQDQDEDIEHLKENIKDPDTLADELEFLEAEYQAILEAIEKREDNFIKMKSAYLKAVQEAQQNISDPVLLEEHVMDIRAQLLEDLQDYDDYAGGDGGQVERVTHEQIAFDVANAERVAKLQEQNKKRKIEEATAKKIKSTKRSRIPRDAVGVRPDSFRDGLVTPSAASVSRAEKILPKPAAGPNIIKRKMKVKMQYLRDVENAKQHIADPETLAEELEFLKTEYKNKFETIDKLEFNFLKIKSAYLKAAEEAQQTQRNPVKLVEQLVNLKGQLLAELRQYDIEAGGDGSEVEFITHIQIVYDVENAKKTLREKKRKKGEAGLLSEAIRAIKAGKEIAAMKKLEPRNKSFVAELVPPIAPPTSRPPAERAVTKQDINKRKAQVKEEYLRDIENAKEALEDPEMQAAEVEFLETEYRARIEAIEKLPINLARMRLTYLKVVEDVRKAQRDPVKLIEELVNLKTQLVKDLQEYDEYAGGIHGHWELITNDEILSDVANDQQLLARAPPTLIPLPDISGRKAKAWGQYLRDIESVENNIEDPETLAEELQILKAEYRTKFEAIDNLEENFFNLKSNYLKDVREARETQRDPINLVEDLLEIKRRLFEDLRDIDKNAGGFGEFQPTTHEQIAADVARTAAKMAEEDRKREKEEIAAEMKALKQQEKSFGVAPSSSQVSLQPERPKSRAAIGLDIIGRKGKVKREYIEAIEKTKEDIKDPEDQAKAFEISKSQYETKIEAISRLENDLLRLKSSYLRAVEEARRTQRDPVKLVEYLVNLKAQLITALQQHDDYAGGEGLELEALTDDQIATEVALAQRVARRKEEEREKKREEAAAQKVQESKAEEIAQAAKAAREAAVRAVARAAKEAISKTAREVAAKRELGARAGKFEAAPSTPTSRLMPSRPSSRAAPSRIKIPRRRYIEATDFAGHREDVKKMYERDVVQAKEQILDPQALSKRLRSLEGDYRAKIGIINRTERELSKLKAGYLRAIKIADMVLASTQEDINNEREEELRLLQGGYLEDTKQTDLLLEELRKDYEEKGYVEDMAEDLSESVEEKIIELAVKEDAERRQKAEDAEMLAVEPNLPTEPSPKGIEKVAAEEQEAIPISPQMEELMGYEESFPSRARRKVSREPKEEKILKAPIRDEDERKKIEGAERMLVPRKPIMWVYDDALVDEEAQQALEEEKEQKRKEEEAIKRAAERAIVFQKLAAIAKKAKAARLAAVARARRLNKAAAQVVSPGFREVPAIKPQTQAQKAEAIVCKLKTDYSRAAQVARKGAENPDDLHNRLTALKSQILANRQAEGPIGSGEEVALNLILDWQIATEVGKARRLAELAELRKQRKQEKAEELGLERGVEAIQAPIEPPVIVCQPPTEPEAEPPRRVPTQGSSRIAPRPASQKSAVRTASQKYIGATDVVGRKAKARQQYLRDVAEAKQTISNRQELAERLSSLESEYQAKVEMIERKDANVLKLKVNYLKAARQAQSSEVNPDQLEQRLADLKAQLVANLRRLDIETGGDGNDLGLLEDWQIAADVERAKVVAEMVEWNKEKKQQEADYALAMERQKWERADRMAQVAKAAKASREAAAAKAQQMRRKSMGAALAPPPTAGPSRMSLPGPAAVCPIQPRPAPRRALSRAPSEASQRIPAPAPRRVPSRAPSEASRKIPTPAPRRVPSRAPSEASRGVPAARSMRTPRATARVAPRVSAQSVARTASQKYIGATDVVGRKAKARQQYMRDVAEAKETISNQQALAERLAMLKDQYQTKVHLIERNDANILKLKMDYMKAAKQAQRSQLNPDQLDQHLADLKAQLVANLRRLDIEAGGDGSTLGLLEDWQIAADVERAKVVAELVEWNKEKKQDEADQALAMERQKWERADRMAQVARAAKASREAAAARAQQLRRKSMGASLQAPLAAGPSSRSLPPPRADVEVARRRSQIPIPRRPPGQPSRLSIPIAGSPSSRSLPRPRADVQVARRRSLIPMPVSRKPSGPVVSRPSSRSLPHPRADMQVARRRSLIPAPVSRQPSGDPSRRLSRPSVASVRQLGEGSRQQRSRRMQKSIEAPKPPPPSKLARTASEKYMVGTDLVKLKAKAKQEYLKALDNAKKSIKNPEELARRHRGLKEHFKLLLENIDQLDADKHKAKAKYLADVEAARQNIPDPAEFQAALSELQENLAANLVELELAAGADVRDAPNISHRQVATDVARRQRLAERAAKRKMERMQEEAEAQAFAARVKRSRASLAAPKPAAPAQPAQPWVGRLAAPPGRAPVVDRSKGSIPRDRGTPKAPAAPRLVLRKKELDPRLQQFLKEKKRAARQPKVMKKASEKYVAAAYDIKDLQVEAKKKLIEKINYLRQVIPDDVDYQNQLKILEAQYTRKLHFIKNLETYRASLQRKYYQDVTKAKETHKDEDRLNEVLDFLRQDFANRLGYIEEQAGIERKPGIQSPDARVKSEVMEVVRKSAGPGMDRPTLAERQSLAGRRPEPPPPPKPKVVKTIKVHPSRKGVPRRGVMQLVVPQQVASEMKNFREVAKRKYEEDVENAKRTVRGQEILEAHLGRLQEKYEAQLKFIERLPEKRQQLADNYALARASINSAYKTNTKLRDINLKAVTEQYKVSLAQLNDLAAGRLPGSPDDQFDELAQKIFIPPGIQAIPRGR